MAASRISNKERKKTSSENKTSWTSTMPAILTSKRLQVLTGFSIIFFAIYLAFSFISYIFTGQADQSVIESLFSENVLRSGKEIQNWLGFMGAILSYIFIYQCFGIASFLLIPSIFHLGYKILYQKVIFSEWRVFKMVLFGLFWISAFLGYFVLTAEGESPFGFFAGKIGILLADILNSMIGFATFFFLILIFVAFVAFSFDFKDISFDFEKIKAFFVQEKQTETKANHANPQKIKEKEKEITVNKKEKIKEETAFEPIEKQTEIPQKNVEIGGEKSLPSKMPIQTDLNLNKIKVEIEEEENLPVSIEKPTLQIEEEQKDAPKTSKNLLSTEELSQNLVEQFGEYDPTLTLSNYKYPTLDLLNISEQKGKVTEEELVKKSDTIIKTLEYFKIGIKGITAKIGPTVTLYEMVPQDGMKISRIKNLEDDIALSLSALGIRMIAPMPGRGVIGIEVPNENRSMVSLRSILDSEEFRNSNKDLPIALGRDISNKIFITDLTKMPHLLIAGATGQGKSVGLNVVLASLLYKKHPSELKFVLIDPKKVELSLFNKIERHFLASLPNAEEAIITDTKMVVNTLQSLCIEMDVRYNLLKEAGCRNLKEYNEKFVKRQLNPEDGHRFMPYIVLVIDELADLMLTAGKEVETPIARLAQLARAIGIHLIVATQRPSVN
ncbi:MAG: DNA translocase FtsK, partial [Bacteroidetes bacterium]